MSQCDELSAGMFVTVIQNKRHESDHSFYGWVLRVEAVDAPFVVVRDSRSMVLHPFSLDTRDFQLMRLSQAYVDAFLGVSGASDAEPAPETHVVRS